MSFSPVLSILGSSCTGSSHLLPYGERFFAGSHPAEEGPDD